MLVVDDEQSIRKLLENELGTPERVVHTAEDARTARQLIKK